VVLNEPTISSTSFGTVSFLPVPTVAPALAPSATAPMVAISEPVLESGPVIATPPPIVPDYCQVIDVYLGKTIIDPDGTAFRSYTKKSCDVLAGTWNSDTGSCIRKKINFSLDCINAPPSDSPDDFHTIVTPSKSEYESNNCAANTILENGVCTKVSFPYPCPVTTRLKYINGKSYCMLLPNENRMQNDTSCDIGYRNRHLCFKTNPTYPRRNLPQCPKDTVKIRGLCAVHIDNQCQDGTEYDSNTRRCIGVPKCGPNTTLDTNTNRCVAEVL